MISQYLQTQFFSTTSFFLNILCNKSRRVLLTLVIFKRVNDLYMLQAMPRFGTIFVVVFNGVNWQFLLTLLLYLEEICHMFEA